MSATVGNSSFDGRNGPFRSTAASNLSSDLSFLYRLRPERTCMLSPRTCWTFSRHIARWPYPSPQLRTPIVPSLLLRSPPSRNVTALSLGSLEGNDTESSLERGSGKPEHAVISAFDLFSIGGECPGFTFVQRV